MHSVSSIKDPSQRNEATPPGGSEVHWLLVIDHQVARIFHAEILAAVPQKIYPPNPKDHFGQAPQAYDFTRGKEKPNLTSFFEPVAQALQGSGKILIFGTGKGSSSEMDLFVAWSKLHHPGLAQRILGTVVVDEHHLTEGQLLARAREFYADEAKGFSKSLRPRKA